MYQNDKEVFKSNYCYCEGIDCPKAEKCNRWIGHLNIQRPMLGMIIFADIPMSDDCFDSKENLISIL